MMNKVQENNAIFTAQDIIIDGDDLWMLLNDTDILSHFDFNSLNLIDYYIVPGEKMVQYAHVRLKKIGDRIYVVPFMESGLFCFNCTLEKIEEINIPYENGELKRKSKFNIVVVWKTQLVLIGHSIKGVFYYDTISGSFEKDVGYLEKLKKAKCDVSDILFSDCYYQSEDKLYIPVYGKNIILEIDLENHINRVYELQCEKEIKIRTIDGYYQDGKEKFLLTTVNDEMIIWSLADGVEKIKELGLLHGEEKIYMRAFCVKGKNYYIAAYERKVFVETENGIRELEFEYEDRGGFEEAIGYTQFEAIFKNGEDIYFQARSNGQLFKIDTEIDAIQQLNFNVTQEKKEEIIREVCNRRPMSDLFVENTWFGLDGFLKVCVCEESK